MPNDPCRSGQRGGATCSAYPVAPDKRVERHPVRCMSLWIGAWSDTLTFLFRPWSSRGATCDAPNVAPAADPRRHALARMSLRTRARCDMDPYAVAPWRSSKATSTVMIVALHVWVRRSRPSRIANAVVGEGDFWREVDDLEVVHGDGRERQRCDARRRPLRCRGAIVVSAGSTTGTHRPRDMPTEFFRRAESASIA